MEERDDEKNDEASAPDDAAEAMSASPATPVASPACPLLLLLESPAAAPSLFVASTLGVFVDGGGCGICGICGSLLDSSSIALAAAAGVAAVRPKSGAVRSVGVVE